MAWVLAFMIWLGSGVAFAASPTADVDVGTVFSKLRALAHGHAYELRLAEEGADQRGSHLYTSWARWFPRVEFQLSQTRGKDYSIITSGALGANAGFITPVETSLSRWQLAATLPLYDRSVHVGVLQGIADHEWGEAERESRFTQLDWRLRQLFGVFLLEAYRDAALKSSIELSESNLRDAQLRFELGQKTKVDVLRAKAHRTELESRRLSLRHSGFNARAALLEYSGLVAVDLEAAGVPALLRGETEIAEAIDSFSRAGGSSEMLEPYLGEDSKASVEDRITGFSPAFRRLQAEEKLNDRQALSLTATEWPSLRLQGTLSKQAPDWQEALQTNQVSYSAAVVLNIPIFTGGSLFSSLAEGRHAAAAAQLKADREILGLRNDVEGAILDVRTLRKSLESLRLSLEQNEEIVRLSIKSYQLGKATIVELLGAQNDLIQSKVELAKAKIDLSVQLRQLTWNLGLENTP